MKSLSFILVGLMVSWYFTDISETGLVESVIAPFGVFIFIVSTLIWLVFRLQGTGMDLGQKVSRGGLGGFFGGDDGEAGN